MRILVLSIVCTLGGCAHYPVNDKLYPLPYNYKGLDQGPDNMLVALSLSGGGVRAAAFAFGVIEALQDIEVVGAANPAEQRPPLDCEDPASFAEQRTLLNDVDIVSSVSGGAMPTAFWAARGEKALLCDFQNEVLEFPWKRAFWRGFWSPRNWFRTLGQKFERGDLMAELWDDLVLNKTTFGDLANQMSDQSDGSPPFFLFNATDLSSGTGFEFTQERFDQLCSDLNPYLLSRALAASMSVPGLSSPITIKNYSGDNCHSPNSYWDKTVSSDAARSPSMSRRATAVSNYREAKVSWIHLFDGGLADNLGLQGLYDVAFRRDRTCTDDAMRRVDDLGALVVIVVDAVLELDHTRDHDENGPSLREAMFAAANIPIDRLSDQTFDGLRAHLTQWVEHCRRKDEPVKIYTILVRIGDVENPMNLQVATGLYADKDKLKALVAGGKEAFWNNLELQRLLKDRSCLQDGRKALRKRRDKMSHAPEFRTCVKLDSP